MEAILVPWQVEGPVLLATDWWVQTRLNCNVPSRPLEPDLTLSKTALLRDPVAHF